MSNKSLVKSVRKAEQEAIGIEMDIMWHQRAIRHKGFCNYSGSMSRDELSTAKERISGLRSFIRENRKTLKPNGN